MSRIVNEEIVEREPSAAGWAVFEGCEGEEPRCVAFFMGRGAKALAAALKNQRGPDGEPVLFDPGIAPAFLDSEVGDGGGLFAANHYDDAEGIKALVEMSGEDPEAWAEHRTPASPPPAPIPDVPHLERHRGEGNPHPSRVWLRNEIPGAVGIGDVACQVPGCGGSLGKPCTPADRTAPVRAVEVSHGSGRRGGAHGDCG